MTDILSLRNGVAQRTTAKNVLKLRKMGLDAQQISGELDMPLDRVKNIISNALKALAKEMKGQAEQIRSLELTRLDELQTAIWTDCMDGKLTAIDRVLKIMERRSKLVGLDAPERLDIKADMKLEHMKEAKERLMSKILDMVPEEEEEEVAGELPAPELED
jgi:orotate phosphoribosyltransferase-like protein